MENLSVAAPVRSPVPAAIQPCRAAGQSSRKCSTLQRAYNPCKKAEDATLNQQQQATEWLDRVLATYYRLSPVNATFIGVHEFDGQLPDCSPSALEDSDSKAATLHGEGLALDLSDLDAVTRRDVALTLGHLEIQRWELQSAHFQRGNPSYYTGEAVFGVMSLFLRDFAPLEQRIQSAAQRLAAIPALLEQARANVPTAHPAWVARAIRECDGALAFLRNGLPLIEGTQVLESAAQQAELAFKQHRAYLATPQASFSEAVIAAGQDAFDMLMKRGHMLDFDADEILRRAEAQAAESEAGLVQGAGEFGHTDWRNVLPQLMDYHPDADAYYQQYQTVWQECRRAAEAHDLLTWPNYPLRYVPRPDWSQEAAPYLYFLFYRSPAPFDDVPIVEYLVTPIEPSMPEDEQHSLLRAHNDSVIKLNHVVHHGSIGHHVQNWHAFRSPSRIGKIAAVDCAARIALFCGGTLAEGWSSYVTELMAEVGFLTPLERYSQQHGRLRMAARAIVDVKLHRGEFTLDDAARYYQERVNMPAGAAMDEAVKNSMFPGAAMIYLIGTDMIHDLRRDMQSTQGADFNLRDFHDEFLSYGSIPVAMIDGAMRSARAE